MNKPEYIVIHHSLTPDGQTVNWDAITRFHTSFRHGGDIVSPEDAAILTSQGETIENPWPYNGYNFGIEEVDGNVILQVGHEVGWVGYHCKDAHMNFRSIGICVVGNFDIAPPSMAKIYFLRDLCYSLMVNYEIPARNVIGHRTAGLMAGYDWEKGEYKTCPGRLFPLAALQSILTGKSNSM